MVIKKVENKYKISQEQSEEVWANIEMDELRRTECLCFNCERTIEGGPASPCKAAKEFYELCKKYNSAMAMTRCGVTDPLTKNLYYIPRQKN